MPSSLSSSSSTTTAAAIAVASAAAATATAAAGASVSGSSAFAALIANVAEAAAAVASALADEIPASPYAAAAAKAASNAVKSAKQALEAVTPERTTSRPATSHQDTILSRLRTVGSSKTRRVLAEDRTRPLSRPVSRPLAIRSPLRPVLAKKQATTSKPLTRSTSAQLTNQVKVESIEPEENDEIEILKFVPADISGEGTEFKSKL